MGQIGLNYEGAKAEIVSFGGTNKTIGQAQSINPDLPSLTLPTAQGFLDALIDFQILLREYASLINLDAHRMEQYVENIKAADES